MTDIMDPAQGDSQVLRDIKMVRRAALGRWPIPDDMIVELTEKLLTTIAESENEKIIINGMKLLKDMVGQNLMIELTVAKLEAAGRRAVGGAETQRAALPRVTEGQLKLWQKAVAEGGDSKGAIALFSSEDVLDAPTSREP